MSPERQWEIAGVWLKAVIVLLCLFILGFAVVGVWFIGQHWQLFVAIALSGLILWGTHWATKVRSGHDPRKVNRKVDPDPKGEGFAKVHKIRLDQSPSGADALAMMTATSKERHQTFQDLRKMQLARQRVDQLGTCGGCTGTDDCIYPKCMENVRVDMEAARDPFDVSQR